MSRSDAGSRVPVHTRDFGGSVPDFAVVGSCTPVDLLNGLFEGTCTAGNVPTEDAGGVGLLFSLGFEVSSLMGSLALEVGILDTGVDDITQGTGQPVYEDGDVIRRALVPEPGTGLLVGVGLLAYAARRRTQPW